MEKNKPRKGRGLDALLGGASIELATPGQAFATPDSGSGKTHTAMSSDLIQQIDLDRIDTNPWQPRTRFEEEELAGLAQSVRQLGIIAPITVRKKNDGRYQIVSGERRCRAARQAELTAIPAYIIDATDRNMQIMALVENIQREDLNPIDIAAAYQNLTNAYEFTQEKISEMVGQKRATVTNYLRLLKMPAEVQSAVREQTISMGHAKVLMGVDDAAAQKDIAKKIVEQGLSVRQVETLVKALQQPKSISNKPLPVGGEIQELMILLKDAFDKHLRGQVSIKTTPDGNIRATIDLKSSEDIQFMIAKLTDD